MDTVHVTVKFPKDVYDDLMEVANKKYEGNRSMTIIKAVRSYVQNNNNMEFKVNSLESEIKDVNNKYSTLDLEFSKLKDTINQISDVMELLHEKEKSEIEKFRESKEIPTKKE